VCVVERLLSLQQKLLFCDRLGSELFLFGVLEWLLRLLSEGTKVLLGQGARRNLGVGRLVSIPANFSLQALSLLFLVRV